MIIPVLPWPSGQETERGKHGRAPEGKQRYRCRACLEGRGRTLLLDDADAGQAPAVQQQSSARALKASGLRDPARVLHGSPTTVIQELQKGTCPASGAAARVAAPLS
jgi:transposase-like protein